LQALEHELTDALPREARKAGAPPELLVSAALRRQRTSSAEGRVHLLDAEAKRSKI